jgi:hypothetical protein
VRYLQIKWSDEQCWKIVRKLEDFETDEAVVKNAKCEHKQGNLRYPHHKFTAEFRVIDGRRA